MHVTGKLKCFNI